MNYKRMPIEIESPEQMEGGYAGIKNNLTESSISDCKFEDIGINNLDLSQLVLAYSDHLGKKELRELVAQDAGVSPDEVLITAGAASALFIINTTILKPEDRLLVEYPNYGILLETPRALGAKVDLLSIKFEEGFQLNVPEIRTALQTKTKLLSVTTPHNPTGTVISENDLREIVDLTKESGTYLLVDETYRDMAFEEATPNAATLGTHVLSVSSLSKTYGLPGIRIGWIICRDKDLMEKFLAAKEQMVICGSVLDEEVAYQFLKKRQEFLPKVKATIYEKRQILFDWFKEQEHIEFVEPKAGVVCFPRLKTTDSEKIDEFYNVLNKEHQTWVGPGHWFEMERRYMRVGYGWPRKEELINGLHCISQTLKKVFK